MEILDTIQVHAQNRQLRYLVAGGHAVNVYAPGRQTGDIDLVIPETERESWKELILSLRYKLHFEHRAFLQFRPPELGLWPLDFILVDGTTFQRMAEQSSEFLLGGTKSHPCVSARNLIAMKCHSAKQPDRDDRLKDIRDIIELARTSSLDVNSEEFTQLCLKYGDERLLEKIRSLQG